MVRRNAFARYASEEFEAAGRKELSILPAFTIDGIAALPLKTEVNNFKYLFASIYLEADDEQHYMYDLFIIMAAQKLS